jgi:hypothetical protein
VTKSNSSDPEDDGVAENMAAQGVCMSQFAGSLQVWSQDSARSSLPIADHAEGRLVGRSQALRSGGTSAKGTVAYCFTS